jgi:hypothetical protein
MRVFANIRSLLLSRSRLPLSRLFAGFAAACLICFIAVASYERLSWTFDPDNKEFERICGQCHSADRPRGYAMSPERWRDQVHLMLSKNTPLKESANPETQQRITDFLVKHRSVDGRTLVRFRCARCHSANVLDPYLKLDDRTLTALLRQHIRQNNSAIQSWEGELIIHEIVEKRPPIAPRAANETALRNYSFQAFCGLCHDATFLYRRMCRPPRSAKDWEILTERMIAKAPDAAGAERKSDLAKRSEEICSGGLGK